MSGLPGRRSQVAAPRLRWYLAHTVRATPHRLTCSPDPSPRRCWARTRRGASASEGSRLLASPEPPLPRAYSCVRSRPPQGPGAWRWLCWRAPGTLKAETRTNTRSDCWWTHTSNAREGGGSSRRWAWSARVLGFLRMPPEVAISSADPLLGAARRRAGRPAALGRLRAQDLKVRRGVQPGSSVSPHLTATDACDSRPAFLLSPQLNTSYRRAKV